MAAAALGWTALPLFASLGVPGRVLVAMRLSVEVFAAGFVVLSVAKSLAFLLRKPLPVVEPAWDDDSSVLVLYLCCGDVDAEALESLCSLNHAGPLELAVHDDSRDEEESSRVRALVHELSAKHSLPIRYLKRPRREGGKPGAVNHVVEALGARHDYLLLCDNDTVALDPDCIPKLLAHFSGDERVAIVQGRTAGLPQLEGSSAVDRVLHPATDVFELFLTHQALHGHCPFIGHAALLDLPAFREAGMLTPGTLADDIDLTLRLAQRGRRVAFAAEVPFGERHPPSYESFRKRCSKWAFGCMQVLHRHVGAVLRTRCLSACELLGLLEFSSFYVLQGVLLAYLAATCLVLPILSPEAAPSWAAAAATGSAILASIYLPVLCWGLKRRRLKGLLALAWTCSLVYGSAAFATVSGTWEYWRRRRKEWEPSNLRSSSGLGLAPVLEPLFGLSLLAVPLALQPRLLASPSLHVFAACFLMVPLISHAYDAPSERLSAERPAFRRGLLARSGAVLAVLLTLALVGGVVRAAAASPARVGWQDGRLSVDGERFLVKGLHYSPYGPGEGPMDGRWPTERLESDLGLIEALGVNTLLVHEAPVEVVAEIAAAGFMVLHAFHVDWNRLEDAAHLDELESRMAEKARDLAQEPNLLAWILGNEVPEWVVERDAARVETLLRRLHGAVRAADPNHPAAHAVWPKSLSLSLDFFEISAVNLYPLWPREVVVMGYGAYIDRVLVPHASGRPLLITEFGANTLELDEQRQARILTECWSEIRQRTSGGVVFAFADEWWKNYDNPIAPGDYWTREYDPMDALRHDLDPEEYYGIVDHQRRPKPAYHAVADMFSEPSRSPRWLALLLLPVALLAVYTAWVLRTSGHAS